MIKNLTDLKQNEIAIIKQVSGFESRRLLEIGFTPGVNIQLIRSAPLGFPIEVKIRGYLLALRKPEAQSVEVEPVLVQ